MMLINIFGISLIGLIIWWFWLYNPKDNQSAQQGLMITVENGLYQPSRIKLPANQAIAIHFLRKDASPCAETVIFPDFDISEELPLNKPKLINLPPMAAGEYTFNCQMQMYRGRLIVC